LASEERASVAAALGALAPEVRSLFASCRALILDCDGVLTDGRIGCASDGSEFLVFHVRDSSGIWQAHKAGVKTGLVTGRASGIPESKRSLFPFDAVRTGALDKAAGLRDVLATLDVPPALTAYVGDDLLDGPALRLAGLPIVVADADPELFPLARYVTQRKGGTGAVREVTDLLLEARGARAAILAERIGGGAR
jgi:3-deoxy-D-manno-octulosonate 8-phosphate phosphatase (KDO 8-P phosphatase)